MSEPGAGTIRGIDADLDLLFAQVEALDRLTADPERPPAQAQRYDFNIRWGTMLSGRLLRIEHYLRIDGLTPDQVQRYGELRTELRRLLPTIERTGLTRPQVPLG